MTIPELMITGESNLLFIIGEAVAKHCADLPLLLTSTPEVSPTDGGKEAYSAPFEQEEAQLGFDAPFINIHVEETGDQLDKLHIQKGVNIVFKDMQVQQKRNFIANTLPGKIRLSLGLVEVDNLTAGPLALQSGFLRLDEDMNGELVFTLMADYKAFNEFCPDWIPKAIRKSVTGTDVTQQHAVVRLGVAVEKGEIDLNSLKASGLQKKGLTTLQKMIQQHINQRPSIPPKKAYWN